MPQLFWVAKAVPTPAAPFLLALLLLFASCLARGFPDRPLGGRSWFYVRWLLLPIGFWVWEILGWKGTESTAI